MLGLQLSPENAVVVGGYMLCSASMLVANKAAVHLVHAPCLILFLQLLGTVVAVKGAHVLGFIRSCDTLTLPKIKAFFPVAIIFTLTIFTNMYSLRYANVETFMVFRFSTPLALSVADYIFLGRELPEFRSWMSLFALLAGGIGYTLTDSFFDIRGYAFCCLWYCIFVMDQVYLKHVVDNVKMESNWGRVYYSNLLPCPLLTSMSLFSNEHVALEDDVSFNAACVVLVSVVLGAAMSYFAWATRALVTATTFTVLGNVCKILTMVLNQTLWSNHADPVGVCFLAFSFAGAYFYKPAPPRLRTGSKWVEV